MIVSDSAATRTKSTGDAAKVCVVDPRRGDYAGLLGDRTIASLRVEFVSRGQEALRAARLGEIDVWVINVHLPDMSGFDLCQMIKSRSPSATVYLLTDDYESEDERKAWSSGAAMFHAKPAHGDWFTRFARAS